MYYRGAAAAIVVYDITSTESFTRAKQWIRELQRQGDAQVVIALAGNKADRADARAVDTEEAAAYAEEQGLIFVETSAKTDANVRELFSELARVLPQRDQRRDGERSAGQRVQIAGPSQQPGPASSKSSCPC